MWNHCTNRSIIVDLKVGQIIRVLKNYPNQAGLAKGDICKILEIGHINVLATHLSTGYNWYMSFNNFEVITKYNRKLYANI